MAEFCMCFSPRHGANKPNKQIKTAKGICLQVSVAGIPPKLGQRRFASFKASHGQLAARCERKQFLYLLSATFPVTARMKPKVG